MADLQLIYLLKMVIFHSYVKLPESKLDIDRQLNQPIMDVHVIYYIIWVWPNMFMTLKFGRYYQ